MWNILKIAGGSLLALAILLGAPATTAAAAKEPPGAARAGDEQFTFKDWAGPALNVYLLRPNTAGSDAPVVFVMHGVRRDADRYFADWRPLAAKHGFVLVVPEFAQADFPGADAYNLGGILDSQGRATPRAGWAFAAIEPLFDAVRARHGLERTQYILYGHSAGAQFAHRFAMLGQGPRAQMVISANAGWYTFPTETPWPYGFAGLPSDLLDRRAALAAPLVILAGEADIDPNHASLRHTPEADAQGPNRFQRAQAFYRAGAEAAARAEVEYGWACLTAPGVDHDDAKASRFALTLIRTGPPAAAQPCRQAAAID